MSAENRPSVVEHIRVAVNNFTGAQIEALSRQAEENAAGIRSAAECGNYQEVHRLSEAPAKLQDRIRTIEDARFNLVFALTSFREALQKAGVDEEDLRPYLDLGEPETFRKLSNEDKEKEEAAKRIAALDQAMGDPDKFFIPECLQERELHAVLVGHVSNRTKNTFKRAIMEHVSIQGPKTVGELLMRDKFSLMGIQNFGEKAYMETLEALDKLGVRVKLETPGENILDPEGAERLHAKDGLPEKAKYLSLEV